MTMTQKLYINRRKMHRREEELRQNPLPPYEHYRDAAVFISRLHRERRQISRDDYAQLRKQALSGDIDGAAKALHVAMFGEESWIKKRY